jgi:quercetin dioxygenase-like cupin family protein
MTTSNAELRHENHGDALAVIATALAPCAGGPPLHVHPTLDASFYVLAGALAFRIGDSRFMALAGASVSAPSGTPHTYANHTTEAARVLITCTPVAGNAHRTDIVGPPIDLSNELEN